MGASPRPQAYVPGEPGRFPMRFRAPGGQRSLDHCRIRSLRGMRAHSPCLRRKTPRSPRTESLAHPPLTTTGPPRDNRRAEAPARPYRRFEAGVGASPRPQAYVPGEPGRFPMRFRAPGGQRSLDHCRIRSLRGMRAHSPCLRRKTPRSPRTESLAHPPLTTTGLPRDNRRAEALFSLRMPKPGRAGGHSPPRGRVSCRSNGSSSAISRMTGQASSHCMAR